MQIRRSLVIALAVIFAALPMSAAAQITIKPVTVQKQVKLPTGQDTSKILARDRVRTTQLSQADKIKIVNDTLKEKGVTTTANSLTLPVKMSVMNPKPSADNFLMYFKPWNVMVTGENVQFSGVEGWNDGSLAVYYTPPTPGYYLFDFSVRKPGDSVFTFFTMDGKNTSNQKYPPGPLNNEHVTFVANFADTKSQVAFLLADQAWTFYECEISQIK